jgi:nucleoside-diphosphate-sugar epimerase
MGLVGAKLATKAYDEGWSISVLDLRDPGQRCDVRNAHCVARAVSGCVGIVHLAAVSRVIWGEQDPALCWATNVSGTRNILDAAIASPLRPWVVFASSREVYGEQQRLPAREDATLAPVNVYGRSKVEGEQLVVDARAAGLRTAVVRLSNVYGGSDDHADRVVPAFVRAAVEGGPLRVDGVANTFDFTHVDDVAGGLIALMRALERGESLPPLHLVTGQPTSLGGLAALVLELTGSRSVITEAPSRTFDVARFYGDPSRAWDVLGWRAAIPLREGVTRLVAALREHIAAASYPRTA